MTLRLLAVHAHPDDESSKGAGTYAYYRSRGVAVTIVSCTGGERGSILNEHLAARSHAQRDMPGLRRLEMQRARDILGIDHRWLGYEDSGMPGEGEPAFSNSFATIPLEISAEPLVRIIRELRPQVLVTYDENGGYPHPDHIRAHELSVYARDAAADVTRYPGAGPAWQIAKLYYDRIFNSTRVSTLFEALKRHQPDSPLVDEIAQVTRWFDRPDTATTHIPVADFLEIRDRALRSHESQVSPESSFFFWPNDIQREAWPFEDFELVDSRVPTKLPETDLFAGIPVEESA